MQDSPNPAPSEILTLYAGWCAAWAKGAHLASLRAVEDDETPEEREAGELAEGLRARLAECRPETMPEIAAMLHLLWDTLGYQCEEDSFWNGGAPSILAVIWRAASGKDGVPGRLPDSDS